MHKHKYTFIFTPGARQPVKVTKCYIYSFVIRCIDTDGGFVSMSPMLANLPANLLANLPANLRANLPASLHTGGTKGNNQSSFASAISRLEGSHST